MLITKRLWIYKARKESRVLYRSGGFYREFIITYRGNDQFHRLLEACDKPVFGIIPYLDGIPEPINRIQTYMNTINCKDNDIILIPTSLCKDMEVEVIMENKTTDKSRELRERINVKSAMLFSSEHPDGFNSAEFLLDPLKLLKDKTSSVVIDKITNSTDLAMALWKLRNDISVVNYNSFNKQLTEYIENEIYHSNLSGTSGSLFKVRKVNNG